jgi:hypothetical protein
VPLYIHKHTAERKRTVPGSYEDKRVAVDPNWVRQPGMAPVGAEDDAPQDKKIETINLPSDDKSKTTTKGKVK